VDVLPVAASSTRIIGVVTVARSDYGIYRSVLAAISAEPGLHARLYVAGAHLSPEFGLTVRDIELDGHEVAARVEMLLSSDTPEGTAKSMGLGVMGFAQAFATQRPDILLVLGDRFEMICSALAALPLGIPVAHIHGGELTLGAMDDALRHCLTKLSHLHFVSCEEYALRVAQLGEEPWRITVSGAPSLDALHGFVPLTDEQMRGRFGVALDPAPLLVTYHPETIDASGDEERFREVLAALDACPLPKVFTMPNADPQGRALRAMVLEHAASRPDCRVVENFGQAGYFTMLRRAAAMVGNSSSGLIEAPAFGLPVVNVGARQEGRARGCNVLDARPRRDEVSSALAKALSPGMRDVLREAPNIHGDGRAGERIARVLRETSLGLPLLRKVFQNVTLAQ
jgi:UDP-hydrolysing UDP-N-acetyl-D-glucosamine 2-epimerase